jgi:hypothetical protein
MKKSMGKPYAGKLHVRFEEGAGRGESSLPLYSTVPKKNPGESALNDVHPWHPRSIINANLWIKMERIICFT